MRTYEVVIIGDKPFVHNNMLIEVEEENKALRARLAEVEAQRDVAKK